MDLGGRLGTEPGNQMNVPAPGHREKQEGRGGLGVWGVGVGGVLKPQAHNVSHCSYFFLPPAISLFPRPLHLRSHHQAHKKAMPTNTDVCVKTEKKEAQSP